MYELRHFEAVSQTRTWLKLVKRISSGSVPAIHEDHIAACSCHRARRNSRGREQRGTTEYLLTTTTIPRKHRMEASWESAAGTRIPGALVLITSLETLARRPKITFRPFFAPMADLRVAVSLDSNSAPSEPPSRGLQTIRNTHIRLTL